MAQEALANAASHSGADEVTVRLVSTPQEILLSVEDNGQGFEPSAVPNERYGLVGINERAKLLGGKVNVETGVGAGTRIGIRVPLLPVRPSVDERAP